MKSRQLLPAILLILISGIFLPIHAQAEILNVPSQYSTIKKAIVYAEKDDTILVSPGNYTGLGNRDLDFGRKPLTLMSLKGPHATILDCQGTSIEPHRVFRLHQRETNKTIIQGFTITGGYAPLTEKDSLSFGGGIIVVNGSSLIVRDCIIKNNFAFDGGGGVYCSDSAAPIFINCIIKNNSTPTENAENLICSGGGVLLDESTTTFENCLISENISGNGGGLAGSQTNLTIISSQIKSNIAYGSSAVDPASPGSGGGLYLTNSNLEIMTSEIFGNRALAENQRYMPGQGGGLFASGGNTIITNCSFVGNSAQTGASDIPGAGGGLYLTGAQATISNSIIAFSLDGAALQEHQPSSGDKSAGLSITCSDFYNNLGGDWIGPLAGYENVDGNFSADPMFCNIFASDFHLLPGSPCEADFNDCQVLIGGEGVGCVTDVDSDGLSASMPFELYQNYPNPFNPTTTISYRLSKSNSVTIGIYNLLGQKVRSLVDEQKPAGLYSVVWDGYDDNQKAVASGIYLYKIIAGDLVQSKKMVFLK